MRKFLVLAGMALTALLTAAAPAAASDFKCNGAFAGLTVDNVVVPRDGVCVLVDSNVLGNVTVRTNAYFESENTRIKGNVQGDRSLTVFVGNESSVGGNIQTQRTTQVFLFNGTVGGNIQVEETTEVVNVCGMNVLAGDIQVKKSATDILIGDPQAEACAGNTVEKGNVQIEENFTEVELVIRGNTISQGNLQVFKNTGPAEKFVQDNTGGQNLQCKENSEPFVGTPNFGWQQTEGQCAGP